MEGQTIRPIIKDFVHRIKDLEDEPLNLNTLHRVSCRLKEIQDHLELIQNHIMTIEDFKRAELKYTIAKNQMALWLKE